MQIELQDMIMYGSSPIERAGGANEQRANTYGTTFVFKNLIMWLEKVVQQFWGYVVPVALPSLTNGNYCIKTTKSTL